MLRRVEHKLGQLSVAALVLLTGWLGLGTPPEAELPADPQPAATGTTVDDHDEASLPACLIVDTDVGVDDFRALATVLPSRAVRAIVVTEGIAGVPGGSSAMSMFLASRSATPAVIPGLASATPPAYDWLPAARAGAERINNFLHRAIPFAGRSDRMAQDVLAAVRDCGRVDVLVLGPWTSYLRYAPDLGTRARVIASGRPFAENNSDNFNCEYDLPACRSAVSMLRRARSAVFVDLPPAGPSATYDPTQTMVTRLELAGMPGLLRAALLVDPTQWLGTRLWDDAAALYLLMPYKFVVRGGHLEPAVSETTFRDLVVNAINAG